LTETLATQKTQFPFQGHMLIKRKGARSICPSKGGEPTGELRAGDWDLWYIRGALVKGGIGVEGGPTIFKAVVR